jgi:hypothetical protein
MFFMARVEIHKAPHEYDYLHNAMAAVHFDRFITGATDRKRHHLPTGTYVIETASSDIVGILDIAKRAALTVVPSPEIVVSGNGQIIFYNCPEFVEDNSLSNLLALFAQQAPTTSWIDAFKTPPTPVADYLSPWATILGEPSKT